MCVNVVLCLMDNTYELVIVWDSFMSTFCKLESPKSREPQNREMFS